MRNERALENIRAVIEQQESEWLKENGFDPTPYKPQPRPKTIKKALSGQFSANRFLGESPAKPEPAEPETKAPEIEPEPEIDSEPEVVEIIPQKDGRHSWLYNEVVKAIRDAAGDGKNTKVIAVFVPVVQNSKEFEDLPVSQSVEVSPVEETALELEDLTGSEDTPAEPELPPEEPEESVEVEEPAPEPEPVAELEEPEAELEEELPLQEDTPQPEEPEPEPEPVTELEPEPEPTAELEEPESESVDHVGDLLPESEHEPDPELAQAFIDMEAKLDENSTEPENVSELEFEGEQDTPELLQEIEQELESDKFTEIVPEGELEEVLDLPELDAQSPDQDEQKLDAQDTDDNIFGEAEPLDFTEIPLPDALDDDEVLDVQEQQ